MFRYASNKFRIFLSQSYITRVFSSQITDSKKALRKKGVALLLVLGTLMVVLVLAGIVLGLISSQSRLTHHQVSRIQAYYAAFAGMNLALENLRTGVWGSATYRLCKSGCSAPDINDADIPYNMTIAISAANASTGIRTIDIFCNYTYTSP
jgi:Tfp pilus assembly protein PilX